MTNAALAAELGNRIRQLRMERGWSQRDLARQTGVVNPSMISYYELGERLPSYATLLRIAEVFRVSTDYLLKGGTGRQIDISGLEDEQIDALLTIITGLEK